jgi:ribonuclease HII
MALLVGIDEAGYGPHLGPLVVAAAAIEFDAAPPAADPFMSPDLWDALAEHVAKRPSGAKGRAVVCDSKIAYASGNLATLERTILGALAGFGVRPASFAELLAHTAVRSSVDGIDGEPWHTPHALALPRAATPEAVDETCGHLAAGLAGLGARVAGVWANVASARQLNHLMDGGRNKAEALFALAADLLTQALERSPDQPIHITMDRHGGRRYYAELLSGAFPMVHVETVEESPGASRYLLHRPAAAAPVAVTVRDKCESWSLPTALASMAAKYVRELGMEQLNGYFQERVPGLKPTAGYGLDAWRFLDDVAAVRAAAGVPDHLILRRR